MKKQNEGGRTDAPRSGTSACDEDELYAAPAAMRVFHAARVAAKVLAPVVGKLAEVYPQSKFVSISKAAHAVDSGLREAGEQLRTSENTLSDTPTGDEHGNKEEG